MKLGWCRTVPDAPLWFIVTQNGEERFHKQSHEMHEGWKQLNYEKKTLSNITKRFWRFHQEVFVAMWRYFTAVSWKHFVCIYASPCDVWSHVISSLQVKMAGYVWTEKQVTCFFFSFATNQKGKQFVTANKSKLTKFILLWFFFMTITKWNACKLCLNLRNITFMLWKAANVFHRVINQWWNPQFPTQTRGWEERRDDFQNKFSRH